MRNWRGEKFEGDEDVQKMFNQMHKGFRWFWLAWVVCALFAVGIGAVVIWAVIRLILKFT